MVTEGIDVSIDWCKSKDTAEISTNPVKMAKLILHDLRLAKDPTKSLYFYKSGVYVKDGETAVQEIYKKYLRAFDWIDRWNDRMEDRMIKFLRTEEVVPDLLDRPILNKINLLNGIYDLYEEHDRAFGESSPDYLTTTQLPIKYDFDARCPAWDKFLREVFPEQGGAELLMQVIGLCMIPLTTMQKSIVLLGTGNNGKGVYLRALQSVVGKNNISNVALHKLSGSQERFNLGPIVGKLVNIFGDIPTKKIEDTSQFKAITGEDTVTVEYKGKQPFSYTPFCRLIFSCQEKVTPHDDNSDGFKRRLMHIPFARVFNDGGPKVGLDILHSLSQPSELSGLFNKIRLLLPDLIENGFTLSNEVAAVIDNYVPVPVEIRNWLTTHIESCDTGFIPTRALFNYYAQHCPTPGGEGFDRIQLIMYMKNLFPDVIPNCATRIWKGEGPIKCYKGVKFKNQALQATILTEAYALTVWDTKSGVNNEYSEDNSAISGVKRL
jgi:P4 family phage/plasmid primase-like protien